jgi:hypothetical protein
MYMLCQIRTYSHSCKGNESKSTCSGYMGEPGGGEGWRAKSCLGILSGEGGFSGKQKPRVEVAGFSGE